MEFASQKGLSPPPVQLLRAAGELKDGISDFRDDYITHQNQPRSMFATGFNLVSEEAWLAESRLYPTDEEVERQGQPCRSRS